MYVRTVSLARSQTFSHYQSSIFQIIVLASSRGGRVLFLVLFILVSYLTYVMTDIASRVMVLEGSMVAPRLS